MTSSSSPGISLMQEGLTYLAGAELPCLVIDVVRGGPGLGTIQPAQSDYFQATKGGGHGDYHLIVLAPASVQEMNDFVGLGFDLAFKYRNPAMILADGVIGQMMEKVQLSEYKPRWTQEEIDKMSDNWALTGKKAHRSHNTVTSLELDSYKQEVFNHKLQEKYKMMEENDVLLKKFNVKMRNTYSWLTDQHLVFAKKQYNYAVKKGIKVGILRPITLYPFPKKKLHACLNKLKVS